MGVDSMHSRHAQILRTAQRNTNEKFMTEIATKSTHPEQQRRPSRQHRRNPHAIPGAGTKTVGNPCRLLRRPRRHASPRSVVEAVTDYLYHHNANTHWHYPTSAETDAMMTVPARRWPSSLAAPLKKSCSAPMQRPLPSTSRAHCCRRSRPAMRFVITELDHHANVGPWQALARRAAALSAS